MDALGRLSPDPTPSEPVVSIGRLRFFGVIVFALISLLISRLWYLQVLRGDEFRDLADGNRSRMIRTPAPRGVITDWEGKPLVTNAAQFTVFVDPNDLPKLPKQKAEREAVLRRLSEIVGLEEDERKELLNQAMRRSAVDPIAVRENVNLHILSRIEENRMDLPGVLAEVEPVRMYPRGTFAAHVLGYIGPISLDEVKSESAKKLGYVATDFIGRDGIEKQYDQYLNGSKGGTYYEVDARGRRKREVRKEKPTIGATVRLTLMNRVQEAAEKALAGRQGAAVAVDPRTGRVLAMVSYPSFDPNILARRPLLPKLWAKLNNKDDAPLLNRAIASTQPPGSTFKIVTSAAGLAEGKIDPYTHFFCAGGMNLGGKKMKRCHGVHGSVSLETALAVSCDTFYYQTGLRLGPDKLALWAHKFGVGKDSGIDLPHEAEGVMPDPAWKKIMAPKFGNPDSGWYAGDTANVSIGQGDVLMTPIQVALLSAAVATGGNIYQPYLVESATSAGGDVVYQAKPTVSHKLGLSEQDMHAIAQGLRSVVTKGTSKGAALPGIAVAGKSGTAEKKSKTQNTTLAWFTCYAPYEKPEIAIAVLLWSKPGGENLHGGSASSPIAKAMMEAYFAKQKPIVAPGGQPTPQPTPKIVAMR